MAINEKKLRALKRTVSKVLRVAVEDKYWQNTGSYDLRGRLREALTKEGARYRGAMIVHYEQSNIIAADITFGYSDWAFMGWIFSEGDSHPNLGNPYGH